MSQGVPELTPAQLLDQPWIKRAARIAAFIAAVASGSVGAYFFSLGNRVSAIESDRAVRTIKTENALQSINSQIISLQGDVATIRADVGSLKTDAATSRGILQEMAHREEMSSAGPRLGNLQLSGFP